MFPLPWTVSWLGAVGSAPSPGKGLLQTPGDGESQPQRQQFRHKEQRTKSKKLIPLLTRVSFVRSDSRSGKPEHLMWVPNSRGWEGCTSHVALVITHRSTWAQAATSSHKQKCLLNEYVPFCLPILGA